MHPIIETYLRKTILKNEKRIDRVRDESND